MLDLARSVSSDTDGVPCAQKALPDLVRATSSITRMLSFQAGATFGHSGVSPNAARLSPIPTRAPAIDPAISTNVAQTPHHHKELSKQPDQPNTSKSAAHKKNHPAWSRQ